MSVLLPFRTDIKKRVCGRIPGNLLGGLIFFLIFPHLPAGLYSVVGIVGGIGVGFSASYGWQAVFNSLGAMMIAVSVIGFPQAVFFRIAQNIFGSLYALCFEKIFHTVTEQKLWFMVRLCVYDSITSIYLFQQNHSHQLMWEGHLGKTKSIIRSCKHSFSKTDRTADYKCNTAFPLYPEFFNLCRKFFRWKHCSSDFQSDHIHIIFYNF